MQIPDIIQNLKDEYCGICQVQGCIATLEKLQSNGMAADKPAPAPAPEPTHKKPLSVRTARKVRKVAAASKTSNPDNAPKFKRGAMARMILAYLDKHPGAKAVDMAVEIGIARSTLLYHLKRLGKKVRQIGTGTEVTWYLADQKPSDAPEPAVDPDSDLDEDFRTQECPKCSELFAGKERLERHMQMVHKKGVAA